MRQDEERKMELKEMLPGYILSCGLFRGVEEKRFSLEHGGVFRCPVCGKRIALFRKTKGGTNPWGINAFEHCGHFGHGGAYSSDIFGMYAAVNRISEKEAMTRLMNDGMPGGGTAALPVSAGEGRGRTDEIYPVNAGICREAQWGDAITEQGRALLALRGIDVSSLPEGVKGRVGYLPRTSMVSRSGRRFRLEGVIFALGDEDASWQIRKVADGRYVRKDDDDLRFVSIGETRPFNESVVLEGSDDEPLFIVEGPFDALSMISAGAGRTIATIGVSNHSRVVEDVDSLGRRTIVMVGFDPDDAGSAGSSRLVGELEAAGDVEAYLLPVAGRCHDANDRLLSDRQGLEDVIAAARGLCWLRRHDAVTREEVRSYLKRLEDGRDGNAVLQELRDRWKEVRNAERKR